MTQPTLYWNLGSQPARAVKTLLDIGKIPCTLVQIDLYQRDQRKKPYLEMYPAGKVPVLKDGDFVLGESGAIMIYLIEKQPNLAKYHGQTVEQRAVVNQYLAWYQNYFRPAMFKPIRLYLGAILMNQSIKQEHKVAMWREMHEAIGKFNEILGKNGSKFIAGDKPTIVDFLFYYEMTNLVYFGQNHQQYADVKRWFTEVYRIPEVKNITHQWFQLSKSMTQMFSNVELMKSKL